MHELPLPSPSNNSTSSTQVKGVPSVRPGVASFKPHPQSYPHPDQISSTFQSSLLGYWGPSFRPNCADTTAAPKLQNLSNPMTVAKTKQQQSQYFSQADAVQVQGARPSTNRTNVYPALFPNAITPVQQNIPVVSLSAPEKASRQHRGIVYAQAGADPLSHARRQLFADDPNQGSVVNVPSSRHYSSAMTHQVQPQRGFHGPVGYFNQSVVDRPQTPVDRNPLVDWGALSGSIHSSVDQHREAIASERGFPQRADRSQITPAPACSQPADFGCNPQHRHMNSQAPAAGHQRAYRALQDPRQHRGRTPRPAAHDPPQRAAEPNAKRQRPL